MTNPLNTATDKLQREMQQEALAANPEMIFATSRHILDYAKARNLSNIELVIALFTTLESHADASLKNAVTALDQMLPASMILERVTKQHFVKHVISTLFAGAAEKFEQQAFGATFSNGPSPEPLTAEKLEEMRKSFATGGFVPPNRRKTDVIGEKPAQYVRPNPRPTTRQGRPFDGDVA